MNERAFRPSLALRLSAEGALVAGAFSSSTGLAAFSRPSWLEAEDEGAAAERAARAEYYGGPQCRLNNASQAQQMARREVGGSG